jgi:sialic acid synthase SpsE
MKKQILISDEFTVDFLPNRNSGRPVCRIEGIVCFLDSKDSTFVSPMSTWIVSVSKIADKFMTVVPLIEMHTRKDNEILLAAKIEALKPVKKERKRVKTNYRYMSFSELKQMQA